jgi:hypothetical protein
LERPGIIAVDFFDSSKLGFHIFRLRRHQLGGARIRFAEAAGGRLLHTKNPSSYSPGAPVYLTLRKNSPCPFGEN